MKTIVFLSFVAALVATASLTSCSPVPHSYLKDQPSVSTGAQLNAQKTSGKAVSENDSILSGDWICVAKNECTYSEITIAQDGSVTLTSAQTGEESQPDAKFTKDHLKLNPENTDELLLDSERYKKKSIN